MKRWLHKFVIGIIARYLPCRGKRVFYILLCYLAWSKSSDVNRIRNEMIEINNRLKLCDNNDALNFAIEIRNVLLTMEEFKPLRESDHNDLRVEAVSIIPEWLEYDSKDNILRDLETVFKTRYLNTSQNQEALLSH